jgi:hypothetical protein
MSPPSSPCATPTDQSRRARHGRVIALALCCALAIAACGSSIKSAARTSSSPLAGSLKYAACMRSHGVPNFPDPTADAEAPAVHVDKRSPAFQTALQACERRQSELRAELVEAKPRPSQARQRRVAECMRSHVVPNFADPAPVGQAQTVPSGVNPMSPAFQRAQEPGAGRQNRFCAVARGCQGRTGSHRRVHARPRAEDVPRPHDIGVIDAARRRGHRPQQPQRLCFSLRAPVDDPVARAQAGRGRLQLPSSRRAEVSTGGIARSPHDSLRLLQALVLASTAGRTPEL